MVPKAGIKHIWSTMAVPYNGQIIWSNFTAVFRPKLKILSIFFLIVYKYTATPELGDLSHNKADHMVELTKAH